MARIIASLLALAAILATRPARADETVAIQGTWKVTAADKNGKPYEKVVGDRFTFAGDKFSIQPHASQRKAEEGTFAVATTANPNTIDFKLPGANKPLLGIVEVTGDRMKLCFREKEGPRPTEFVSTPESAITLLTMERGKP